MTPIEREELNRSFKQLNSTFRRRRERAFPKISNLNELSQGLQADREFRQRFCNVDRRNSFRGKVSVDEHVAVIFLNPEVQTLAPTNSTLFCDGTFRTAILDSAQVLNLFVLIGGVVRISSFLISFPFS